MPWSWTCVRAARCVLGTRLGSSGGAAHTLLLGLRIVHTRFLPCRVLTPAAPVSRRPCLWTML